MSVQPGLTSTVTGRPDDADRALLDRYRQQGDRVALEQLLERHAGVAYRVALRFAGNPADADDVLQDAFISCMASANGFRGDGPVRSWIIAIVANAWRRRARAQRRRRAHEGAAMGSDQPAVEDGSSDELRLRALACLGGLSEHYRVPVTMRYLDGLDYPDIASALGSKENSVRTRVHRGLEQLRSALGHRGVAVGAPALGMAMAGTATPAVPSHLPALVQASLAKGAALPAAQLAATAIGGTWLTTPVIIVLVVVCALATGGIGAWRAHRPAPVVVAAATEAGEPPPVVEAGIVAKALAQPVSFRFDGHYSEAMVRLRLALPHGLRVPIVGLNGNGRYGTPDEAHLRFVVKADLHDRPLRDVLDALCASGGLRWRSSSAGIVIDKQAEAKERERLIGAFAQAEGEALAAAAQALYRSDDVDCLRPLVLAAAGGGARAEAAVKVLMPSDGSELMDPVIAFSDDREVCAAVLSAVEDHREPQVALIRIAGRLRLGAAVDGCVSLARAGVAPENRIERMLGHSERLALAMAATDALGWLGDRRAVGPLLEIMGLKAEAGRWNPEAVAVALGRIGDPRATAPLLAIAGDRRAYGQARKAALLAVAEIGESRVAAPIGAILLEKSEDMWVRQNAAQALGILGGPQAADILRQEAARGDSDEHFTSGAAMSELGFIPGPESEAVLMQQLDARSSGEYASGALARLADPDLVPRLKERLLIAANEDSYRHIANALSGMRTPVACRALLDTIPADGSRFMWYHLGALTACGTPGATRAVIDLTGRGPATRKVAARFFAKCGPEGIALAIRLAEGDPDREVRMAAISAFNELSYREDVLPRAVLVRWLGHADASIRLAGIRLLFSWRQLGGAFVPDALLAATRDADIAVRLESIRMLTDHQDDPRLLERCLAMAAGDPAAEVRENAAKEIFHFFFASGGRRTREELQSAADHLLRIATGDAEPRVRAQAGIVVMKLMRDGESGRKKSPLAKQRLVMEELRKTDPDERVRATIARMLDPANNGWLNADIDWPAQAAAPAPVPAPASEF